MAKKKRKKQIDDSNKVFIIFVTIALVVLLVVWVVKDNKNVGSSEETPVTIPASVNSFTKVSLSQLLNIINDDKLTFVYLGYEGCRACDKFVPTLVTVKDEFDMEVYYINTKELDRNSSEWKKFTNLLTKEVTLDLKKDGSNKKYTKTIGKFLYEEGYTPTFVVLKKGKIIDGNIGAMKYEDLKEFIGNAGFIEK